MLQAGTFGADAFQSIWHRGFHVILTICHCAQFFSFFHSTLLESDRAARGRSLFEQIKMCILLHRSNLSNLAIFRQFVFADLLAQISEGPFSAVSKLIVATEVTEVN